MNTTFFFSKDNERKPFLYGTYVNTDNGDTICPPPQSCGGIKEMGRKSEKLSGEVNNVIVEGPVISSIETHLLKFKIKAKDPKLPE